MSQVTDETKPASIHPFRLDFLDGIRGLAALFVVISHAFTLGSDPHGKTDASLTGSHWIVAALAPLKYAHFAVAIFIVLSGFCLMLPVARARNHRLKGGVLGFTRRRSIRILPPYYAALAMVLALLFVSHHFLRKSGDAGSSDLSFANIGLHVLLLHNGWLRFNNAFDMPMWSVAMEWQIYFIFALILLPVFRFAGSIGAVVVAFAIGLAPLLILPTGHNLDWTCPWYIGLFAIGMAAASILYAGDRRAEWARNRTSQLLIFCGTAALFVTGCLAWSWWIESDSWFVVMDVLVGILAVTLIMLCAAARGRPEKAAASVLQSRPVMVLGAFSYSLYLIHYPILQKMRDVMDHRNSTQQLQLTVLTAVGIPACLVLGYLFHRLFERPFMPGRPKTERKTEIAAILSPAP